MKRGEGSSESRVGLSSTRHAVRVQQKGFQSIVVVVVVCFADRYASHFDSYHGSEYDVLL